MAGILPSRSTAIMVLLGIAVLFVCLYFTYAATKGPYGIYEKGRIEAQIVFLQKDLAHLEEERASAENRVRRLSDEYLDLDLLDEQARRVLGMIRADEIAIPH